MILDMTAVRNMAQQKANADNRAISIYQRKTGEYIVGRDITLIKQMLGATEQIHYIETIQPEVANEV